MAWSNIYERREEVSKVIKGAYSINDLKQIAQKFGCTYTSVLMDTYFLKRTSRHTLFPGKRIKNKVLMRDNYTCQYCGNNEKEKLIVDHVIPVCLGGIGMEYNLVAACGSCNTIKRNKVGMPKNIEVLCSLNKRWYNKIKKLYEKNN